jgi:hypothetical protein
MPSFPGQVQQNGGILAAGEQQHGVAAFGSDLTDDEKCFRFKQIKLIKGLTCS